MALNEIASIAIPFNLKYFDRFKILLRLVVGLIDGVGEKCNYIAFDGRFTLHGTRSAVQ